MVKGINDGLNTPDSIYMEGYGHEGAEVHFHRGEDALAGNDMEKALLEFKYAVIAYPQHAGALGYLRGEKLGPLNIKRTTGAQSLFEDGMVLLGKEAYKKAISCFSKAINMCPVSAVGSFGFRGKSYLARKKYQESIDDFSIALQYSPNVAEYFYDRGRAYLELGMESKAGEDFERAIELNPGYAEAGELLANLGRE